MSDQEEVCFVCGSPDPEYDSTTGPDGLLKVVPVCGIACETQYLQMRGLHVLPRKRKGGKKAKPATVDQPKEVREVSEGDSILLQAMLKLIRDTAAQAACASSPKSLPLLSKADALAHADKMAAAAAAAAAAATTVESPEVSVKTKTHRRVQKKSGKRAAPNAAVGEREGSKSRRR